MSSAQSMQLQDPPAATLNVRLSILLFPPATPLLTVEVRTIGNLTIQGETNFVSTHGINLKYYLANRMDGLNLFLGNAWVQNPRLRQDRATVLLPYLGVGFAHRFGDKRQWDFDSRIGLGKTINADDNAIYPVVKTGVGYVF